MNLPGNSAPRVVAIGGGHGLSASLRACRRFAAELTAIVSVADDGGSTGRLREMQNRAAPGDLRKSLIALAGSDSLLTRTLDHRFDSGALEGHPLGNLLIAALEEQSGDLVVALDEIGRITQAVGRVLPSTSESVRLIGTTVAGATVDGQVEVMGTEGVWSVRLDPPEPAAPDAAVDAILDADVVVLGPGSLYTSVLAATAVPSVRSAVDKVRDRLVYVGNLRPQVGETAGYTLRDHEAALHRHGLYPSVFLFDAGAWPGGSVAQGGVAARLTVDGQTHDPELLGLALQAVIADLAVG